MPLSLPIYFLGRTYVLHTRIQGRQFKRRLKTSDPRVAEMRAIQLLGAAHMTLIPKFSSSSDAISERDWRAFELDVKNGVFKTDGTDKDYERMKLAYEMWMADKHLMSLGPILGGFPRADGADRADARRPRTSEVFPWDLLPWCLLGLRHFAGQTRTYNNSLERVRRLR